EGAGGKFADWIAFGKDERAEQDALGFRDWFGAVRGDAFGALRGGLLEFLAHEGGVDAELVGGIVGKLAAADGMRHASNVRQQEVQRLHLGLGGVAGEELARALDEVVGVALGVAQCRAVGLDAVLAYEAVGVEAAFEGDNLDVEVLFSE